MPHILIVEDDLQLNDGIRLALKGKGYDCVQCDTLAAAGDAFQGGEFDLILLDINLPDGNGLDWMVWIRERSRVPIILISANNMEMDVITGLELGANDYITKPFSLMILRTRIAVWLREKRNQSDGVIQTGPFQFDFYRMDYRAGDRKLELSRTEQRLLQKLVEHPGITLSRERLTDEIWSGESEYVEEHALTVVMKRLRDKLGVDDKGESYIRTVYGIGYVWEREDERRG